MGWGDVTTGVCELTGILQELLQGITPLQSLLWRWPEGSKESPGSPCSPHSPSLGSRFLSNSFKNGEERCKELWGLLQSRVDG